MAFKSDILEVSLDCITDDGGFGTTEAVADKTGKQLLTIKSSKRVNQ